jgi:type VI protein secretion system component VasF
LHRNCHLKHVTEGKIEETGGRERRRMQLLNDLKETRRYWKLKEEALNRTLWKTHFGGGYRPVIKTDYMMMMMMGVVVVVVVMMMITSMTMTTTTAELTSSTLKTEATGSCETQVLIYQTTR